MLFAANAFDHVMDSFHIHLFETLHLEIPLPHFHIGHGEYGITKYTVLMILAAIIICGIYLPLANKIRTGEAPKGTWWNLFESVLTFIRDEVAKPNLGHKYERYIPLLLTIFFFILINNIFGLIPGSANVTGNIAYRHYSYNERDFAIQDYRANILTTSLRFTF